MPAQWTADVLGEMHLKGITGRALAAKIGWSHTYLSSVLNGHRAPRGAEQTIRSALYSFSDDTDCAPEQSSKTGQ